MEVFSSYLFFPGHRLTNAPLIRAGQHLSIRLFFSPPTPKIQSAFRIFEAHPFSISNAPPSVGVLNSGSASAQGIELYARSCGTDTWTGDLYATAQLGARVAQAKALDGPRQVLHMLALVEGPYGGIGPYTTVDEENVLLVAGGSGMGFTLGVLDELVGRRIREGRGGKIEVVWAVRERCAFLIVSALRQYCFPDLLTRLSFSSHHLVRGPTAHARQRRLRSALPRHYPPHLHHVRFISHRSP